jgi:hypothetical protein
MGVPNLEELRQRVLEAEQLVSRAKSHYGETSQEYKAALKQFAVTWFVLKQTRDETEFLHEIM